MRYAFLKQTAVQKGLSTNGTADLSADGLTIFCSCQTRAESALKISHEGV